MASIVEGYLGEQLSFDALDKMTWENLRLKFGNYFEIPTCAELLCRSTKTGGTGFSMLKVNRAALWGCLCVYRGHGI